VAQFRQLWCSDASFLADRASSTFSRPSVERAADVTRLPDNVDRRQMTSLSAVQPRSQMSVTEVRQQPASTSYSAAAVSTSSLPMPDVVRESIVDRGIATPYAAARSSPAALTTLHPPLLPVTVIHISYDYCVGVWYLGCKRRRTIDAKLYI